MYAAQLPDCHCMFNDRQEIEFEGGIIQINEDRALLIMLDIRSRKELPAASLLPAIGLHSKKRAKSSEILIAQRWCNVRCGGEQRGRIVRLKCY